MKCFQSTSAEVMNHTSKNGLTMLDSTPIRMDIQFRIKKKRMLLTGCDHHFNRCLKPRSEVTMKTKRLLLLLILSLILGACSISSASGYSKIEPQKAKEMLDNDPSILLIDVRTQSEYDEGHITNAILIPNETIGTVQPTQLPDKTAIVLVYCRSGNRSKQAADKLIKMGYQHIYDFGGITFWPYEIVKS